MSMSRDEEVMVGLCRKVAEILQRSEVLQVGENAGILVLPKAVNLGYANHKRGVRVLVLGYPD